MKQREVTDDPADWGAPDVRSDGAFGEWFRDEVIGRCGSDPDAWTRQVVLEIAAALNETRQPAPALEVVVLDWGEVCAFTLPGRTIYLTHALAHRVANRDGIAFVIAHEMAHHDLGHTRVFGADLEWLPALARSASAPVVIAIAGASNG
jgi:Zn-dependent protease with chaperone function